MAEFFANRQTSLVAMESCGGVYHWARTLVKMGHRVKLLPAKHVKAFLLRDINECSHPSLNSDLEEKAGTHENV